MSVRSNKRRRARRAGHAANDPIHPKNALACLEEAVARNPFKNQRWTLNEDGSVDVTHVPDECG